MIDIEGLNYQSDIHPPGFGSFTKGLIKQIIDQISRNVSVKKIILFGSYANLIDKPDDNSDIDLLVIMETEKDKKTRIRSLAPLFHPYLFPMDIIVRTPEEIENELERKDQFIGEIMDKGQVIYEQ